MIYVQVSQSKFEGELLLEVYKEKAGEKEGGGGAAIKNRIKIPKLPE